MPLGMPEQGNEHTFLSNPYHEGVKIEKKITQIKAIL